jgi:DNA-3-methyladenine glycosylase I
LTPVTTKPIKRCVWAGGEAGAMWTYHDTEWGLPNHDDRRHFEFLVLEGAQAGLSWSTILNKRAGYRKNFAEFDPAVVARFTPKRVDKILLDAGIVRNRMKVESCVKNAQAFLEIQEQLGSFDNFIWSFVDGKPVVNTWQQTKQIPASTKQSDALAKALKQRGFKFCGTTIMYAHMQACGLVNDHLVDCFRYAQVKDTSRTAQTRSA